MKPRSFVLSSVTAAALMVPAQSVLADATVFAFNMRGTTQFMSFDLANPGGTQNIIASGVNWRTYAMDFDLAGQNLYILENLELPFGGTANIGTVDLATGAVNYITGITGDAAGVSLGGLAFSPNGLVYANSSDSLYTIDLVTGNTSLVGSWDGELMIDIAVDNNGVIYGHGITSDALFTIDANTAELNLVGTHGLAANFAQGMGFDRTTNELYATIYTGGGSGQFVHWNTTDGSVDAIFDTSVWGTAGAEMTMAIQSALPAPGAMALLGLAGLVGARRRRA